MAIHMNSAMELAVQQTQVLGTSAWVHDVAICTHELTDSLKLIMIATRFFLQATKGQTGAHNLTY